MSGGDLAVRQPLRLEADPARVIAKLFVPGPPDGRPAHHVSDAVRHILALDDAAVSQGLAELVDRFGDRHRDLRATFELHASRVSNRIGADGELSVDRRLLLGATFTHEYSVEAAALCNPSLVLAPGQGGTPPGSAAMVMSTRGIGEGHRSSIGFRSVQVGADGRVAVAPTAGFASTGVVSDGTLHADAFRDMARRSGDDAESSAWVLSRLGAVFTPAELEARLGELEEQGDTRRDAHETVERFRALAARTYRVGFPSTVPLDERILYPATSAESGGVEDARFVRFVDDDGPRYYATYTAYDGRDIAAQLLETTDFATFDSSPLQGPSSRNKGLALFPRRIGGRFTALTRSDGSTNGVASTEDVRHWPRSAPLVTRPALWSAIQVGNCGAPIETAEGWLVLTHGVGPMRSYAIGACLLDLDDPTEVVAELDGPLLSPTADEQDGYVPNVVYSCGAASHAGQLVIPYGIGDAAIGFASVSIDALLAAMDAT